MCMCNDGRSVFRAKKQYLYSKIWEFWANGVKGSKFLVEYVIFGIADPDLPKFTMQLLWGYDDD